MSKRGQITVFLIISIVLLLLAAGFFFIFSNIKKAPLEVESEESRAFLDVRGALQSLVESCIEEIVDPAVYLLAVQGGIIYPDENMPILLTDFGLINYAWLNGVNGLSREKMQEDLGRYLKENIDFCFAGFETFRRQNISVEVNYEETDAKAAIQDSSINLDLALPMSIRLPNGDMLSLDKFSGQLQSRLGEMLRVVENLNYPNIKPQDFIDVPYHSAVFPFDESITIYSLSMFDPRQPLSFIFAVRDDFPENEDPVLDYIPDKAFSVGDRWIGELTAADPNNDILTFSSDSNIFSIDKGGLINIEMTAAGIFDVVFSVEDGRGGKDEQEVSILVLEDEK